NLTESGGIQKLAAMDLGVGRKCATGISSQSQYTLAKNQSDDDDDGERGTPEDAYNRARDMRNVSFMPRNRWVNSVLYDLPFGNGRPFASHLNRFVNRVVGGWNVSAI